MDISQFAKPDELESEIWIDGPDGARFKIRSAESSQYRKRLAALQRKVNPSKLKRDPDLARGIAVEAMADAILIDFEGITLGTEPLPCNEETKLKLLKIPEIRDLIATEAQDLANFKREALAEDADAIKSSGPVGS